MNIPLHTQPKTFGESARNGARRRRTLRGLAALSIAALALTACGGGGDAAAGGDEEVTLRFAWWGSSARHEKTQEMIDIFEEQNPGINIDPEYGEWSGYWDKLSTQIAAGDTPDIMQMDLLYIREYADNGVLLDLADVPMDDIPEDLRVSGATDEGVWGIPHGVTAYSVLVNKTILDEAGIALPDDTTWTWDDFKAFSQEINEKTDVQGLTNLQATMTFELWLRQHGKEFLTEDGQLGWEPADLTEYYEFYKSLLDDGALAPASVVAEDQLPPLDQTLLARNETALGTWWSTQMTAVQAASGDQFEILRLPSQSGQAADAQLWYKTSMFFSASSRTEHPEEAKKFIDFLVNSTEAAEISGTERGMLANQKGVEHIREQLTETEKQVADYIFEIEPELGNPVPVPPTGVSDFQNIHLRYDQEVLFGRLTPEQAAEQMYAEMEAALQ